MGFHQRIWIPDPSSDFKSYTDEVYIYDAGDFVGYLTVKNGNKRWAGYSVVSREKTHNTIEEILEPAHAFAVPMKFFSIQQYPAKIENFILWIPGWKIQLKQPRESAMQQQQDFQQQQEQKTPLPLKQHRHPKPSQPSPQQPQSYPLPSFQSPPKSPSETQELSQRSSQNKSNNASRPKALPSSNPASREKPKQSTQAKSEARPLQSFPADHTSPLSQWYPISPVSPSLPPLSKPEGSNQQSTSSSPIHSSLKHYSPSQRARRPRGGKFQRPISAQPSSHE
jgi:hypothetical protein